MKITDPNEINKFLLDQANVPEDGIKLTQAQAIEVLDERTRALLDRTKMLCRADIRAMIREASMPGLSQYECEHIVRSLLADRWREIDEAFGRRMREMGEECARLRRRFPLTQQDVDDFKRDVRSAQFWSAWTFTASAIAVVAVGLSVVGVI